MHEKDTVELENELSRAKKFENFLENNKDFLLNFTLDDYLNYLMEQKKLLKNDIVKKSQLNAVYAYHIFAGRKKNPAREKAIALALAMELSVDETQRLLYYSGNKKLYAKNSWDSVILFAIQNKFSVERTNNLLLEFHEQPLIGDFK